MAFDDSLKTLELVWLLFRSRWEFMVDLEPCLLSTADWRTSFSPKHARGKKNTKHSTTIIRIGSPFYRTGTSIELVLLVNSWMWTMDYKLVIWNKQKSMGKLDRDLEIVSSSKNIATATLRNAVYCRHHKRNKNTSLPTWSNPLW